jgi:hypothetical protein
MSCLAPVEELLPVLLGNLPSSGQLSFAEQRLGLQESLHIVFVRPMKCVVGTMVDALRGFSTATVTTSPGARASPTAHSADRSTVAGKRLSGEIAAVPSASASRRCRTAPIGG